MFCARLPPRSPSRNPPANAAWPAPSRPRKKMFWPRRRPCSGRPQISDGSAAHNFSAVDPFGRVAGVDHQLSLADDLAVIVIGVVGDDHDAIVLTQFFQFGALHLQIVLASLADDREIR